MMLNMRLSVACAMFLAGVTMATADSPTGKRPRLFTVGNPLLDLVATVRLDFLEKYKLTAGDGVLQTEAQQGIYEELVQKYSPQYLPGGSELNTARTLKAIWKQDGDVAYLGAVGTDESGRTLEELAWKEGLQVHFQKVPDLPTGKCAVLVSGHDRTLCTNLGASSEISLTSKEKDMVPCFDAFYITSYVLHSCPEGIARLANWCVMESKLVNFSFSSTFSVISQKTRIRELLPNVNILFGNNAEYTQFASELGLLTPDDGTLPGDEMDKKACLAIFDLMNKREKETAAPTPRNGASSERSPAVKVAVMTRAAQPVMVAESK